MTQHMEWEEGQEHRFGKQFYSYVVKGEPGRETEEWRVWVRLYI